MSSYTQNLIELEEKYLKILKNTAFWSFIDLKICNLDNSLTGTQPLSIVNKMIYELEKL